jgi:hypothetical protein
MTPYAQRIQNLALKQLVKRLHLDGLFLSIKSANVVFSVISELSRFENLAKRGSE